MQTRCTLADGDGATETTFGEGPFPGAETTPGAGCRGGVAPDGGHARGRSVRDFDRSLPSFWAMAMVDGSSSSGGLVCGVRDVCALRVDVVRVRKWVSLIL